MLRNERSFLAHQMFAKLFSVIHAVNSRCLSCECVLRAVPMMQSSHNNRAVYAAREWCKMRSQGKDVRLVHQNTDFCSNKNMHYCDSERFLFSGFIKTLTKQHYVATHGTRFKRVIGQRPSSKESAPKLLPGIQTFPVMASLHSLCNMFKLKIWENMKNRLAYSPCMFV